MEQARGEVSTGMTLPVDCALLIPVGSTVQLVTVAGEEIELTGPIDYDVATGEQSPYTGSPAVPAPGSVAEVSTSFIAPADVELDSPSRAT